MIEAALEILAVGHPMTVRQVFYRLVSRQVIQNARTQYQAVSNALVEARREGVVPWGWIEDRLRRPRHVSMWEGLHDFAETCRAAYRRDVWSTQPEYVEVWLEKDALSGIFEDVLENYGVTLNVGRGYDGWASIHSAACRFNSRQTTVHVVYFGDFDPSGEDMARSLKERLGDCGSCPEIVKAALTQEDIERYDLPPNFTKTTDTRRAAFVAKFGDQSVELDALPVEVLRSCLVDAVESLMDLDALRKVTAQQETERRALTQALRKISEQKCPSQKKEETQQ